MLNIPVAQLPFILNGVETRRYHTQPVLRTQDIGNHSCRVALICAWLAGQEEPGVGANLLMAALTHDLAEHKMGDLPAPVKRSLPAYGGIDDLSDPPVAFRDVWSGIEEGHLASVMLDWNFTLKDTEKRWLKLADAADGCFYCIRERMMGNKLIKEVFSNFRDYVRKLITEQDHDYEQALADYIDAEWEEACR